MENKKKLIKKLCLWFAAIMGGTLLTGILFFFITSGDINESMIEEKLQYARILASYMAEGPEDAESLKDTKALQGYTVRIYGYQEGGQELALKLSQGEAVEEDTLYVWRLSETNGNSCVVEVSAGIEELYRQNQSVYLRIFAVLFLCAAAGYLVMAGIIIVREKKRQRKCGEEQS